MNKVLCLFLVSLFSNHCFAQLPSFAWAKKMGGSDINESGNSIALDAAGNVITVGYFQGTSDFDPGTGVLNLISNGSSDLFISKSDASGNLIWAKSLGGNLEDIAQAVTTDASGNVYLTGSFESTVDFDPGTGVFNLTAIANDDMFLLKLDASGNFVWAKRVANGYGRGIKIDPNGDVYTIGYYYGSVDFDPNAGVFNQTSTAGSADLFVLKLSSTGNFIWAKSIGAGGQDKGEAMTLDASGNVYATGVYNDIVDFDPGAGVFNIGSIGAHAMFVLKLTSAGNFVWVKSTSGGNADGLSIAIDASNNIYTTGSFQFTVDFDPGLSVFNMTNIGSYYNIFISKLDASGNFVWAKRLGTIYWEAGRCVTTDATGNVYVTGEFRGTMDMDPGVGVYNLSSSLNDYDLFILKLDAGGNFIWAKSSGSASYIYGKSIVLNSLNEIYTTGSFGSTVDFDFGAGTFNLTANGSDIFVHKMYQSPCINPTIPSVNSSASTICSGQSVTLSIDTGSLNSAATWKWYSGSCGGTIVGTGNSITVSPVSSTIYYVRGDGGCITPGLCTSKTITVNPSPTVTATNVSACSGSPVTLLGNPAGGSFSVANPYVGASATYTYTYTNAFGCSTISLPATITINSLPSISVTAAPGNSVCVGSSIILTASGANTYSWSNGSNSPANNVAFVPSSSSVYTVTATDSNGCTSISSISINVINPTPVTTEDSRCGSGVLNLSATGSGSLTWYDAPVNGNIVHTGTSFSPTLSATTTYYVENTVLANTSTLTSTLGAVSNTIGAGGQSTLAQWQVFDVLQPCTLQSVIVYPGAAGNVILEQRNSTGTAVINTTTISVTAAQIGTAVTMILNWPLTVGTGYRIYRNASSVSLYRNSTGGLYPYSNSSISITGNSVSANNYWWAYNWTIVTPVTNYCTSNRVPVIATIHPLPVVTASHVTGCAGSPVTLIGSPSGIGGAFSQPNPYTGSSTSYLYFYMDAYGCSNVSSPASITIDTCNLTLQLKLYLQGYYAGSGMMVPTLYNEGLSVNSTMTDVIIAELHSSTFPYTTIVSTTATLNTNGTASCIFKVASGSYYVVIKHRNSIETWSANPITINTSVNNYDFSINASNAFGNNMKQLEMNVWAIYTGDVNQDDNIDLLDAPLMESDINQFYFGYYSTDLNGDGNVDLLDVPLMEDNIASFVFSQHP